MGNVSVKNMFFSQIVLDFLKGIIIALLISLGLIIAFAFLLKWFDINDNFIPAITLLVKGLSVLIGSLIAIKGDSKGLLKGVCFGSIYIFLAFVIFSILSGNFSINLSILLDLAFAAIIGGIVGIIKVNKNSKF